MSSNSNKLSKFDLVRMGIWHRSDMYKKQFMRQRRLGNIVMLAALCSVTVGIYSLTIERVMRADASTRDSVDVMRSAMVNDGLVVNVFNTGDRTMIVNPTFADEK